MKKVSIIIPIYNAEKYLAKCIESIMSQTIKEIEIICVDNNSTDKSCEIVEEYGKKDSRVISLSCSIASAGAARNCGLDIAKGEYVTFLDADDWMYQDTVEKAYNRITKDKADVCIYDYDRYDTNTESIVHQKNMLSKIIKNRSVICLDDTELVLQSTNPTVWNKLFRREFIKGNGIVFQESQWANDVYFAYSSLCLANKISVIEEPLLVYRLNHGGNIQSKEGRDVECCMRALLAVKKKLIANGIYDKAKNTLKNAVIVNFFYNYKGFSSNDEQSNKLINIMCDCYAKEFEITNLKKSNCMHKQAYDLYAEKILARIKIMKKEQKEKQIKYDGLKYKLPISRKTYLKNKEKEKDSNDKLEAEIDELKMQIKELKMQLEYLKRVK